jgi:hypothetical protein
MKKSLAVVSYYSNTEGSQLSTLIVIVRREFRSALGVQLLMLPLCGSAWRVDGQGEQPEEAGVEGLKDAALAECTIAVVDGMEHQDLSASLDRHRCWQSRCSTIPLWC